MRLKRFEVKNYKNFKDTFVMDFSKIHDYLFNKDCIKGKFIKNAIIYGKNAVGKSNFGKAILDITNHLVDNRKDQTSSISYLNADSDSDRAWFRYTFSCKHNEIEVVYEYEKDYMAQVLSEKLLINDDIVFSYDYKKKDGILDNLQKYEMGTLNWQFRDEGISLLRYMANNLQLNDKHPVRKLMKFVDGMLWFRSLGNNNEYIGFTNKLENMDDYIIRNGFVRQFEDFLQKYGVDEHLEAIEDITNRKNLYFKHKRYIPFSAASNGTNALLTLYYWYVQMKKATFVFIDEFDAFYHFELAEELMKLAIKNLDIQVVFTSHNTNLLTNRFMRPDCCFILTRKKLSSFADATPRILQEGNNLEKLYMGGEFDG